MRVFLLFVFLFRFTYIIIHVGSVAGYNLEFVAMVPTADGTGIFAYPCLSFIPFSIDPSIHL